MNVKEPSRAIPVVDKADVLVAGAGPAGVIAEVAAAGTGQKQSSLKPALSRTDISFHSNAWSRRKSATC